MNVATDTVVKVNATPTDNRIFVIPEEESTSAGGIVLTGKQEKSSVGTLIAKGPGSMKDDGSRQAMTLEVGQKVLFGKYAGTEVELDGRKFLVMNADDVIGTINS